VNNAAMDITFNISDVFQLVVITFVNMSFVNCSNCTIFEL